MTVKKPTKKKRGSIMHVELDERLRSKLDAIAEELKADPRIEHVRHRVSRQVALRYAVNAYTAKAPSAVGG